MSTRWLERIRRPEAALFALALGSYAYFFQAGGWNANSRLALVRSLVERHTVVIDGYEESTGDLAFRDGHFYCDKAPGVSWLAVPAYAAVHALAGPVRGKGRMISLGAYLSTVWAVALPSAAAVVALYMAGQTLGLSAGAAAALALAYAFGTLAFPYSTLFYGHQLAAALLFVGFTLLLRIRHGPETPGPTNPKNGARGPTNPTNGARGPTNPTNGARGPGRLFLAGLLLGYSIVAEYPAALGVAAILAYTAAFLRPRRLWLYLLAGMAGPLLALAFYHAVAFGSPLRPPYAFSTDTPRHQGLAFGLVTPSLVVLYRLTLSRFRGLFYSSPWLFLALPGLLGFLGQHGRRWRREAMVCAAVPALYLALNVSIVDWNGGWAMGPRYLVPALPFLALLAAGAPRLWQGAGSRLTLSRRLAAAGLPAVAYSVALMLMATAVRPEVPTWIYRPFGDYIVPRFLAGDLAVSTLPAHVPTTRERREAWNVGQRLGLESLPSLLPLGLWTAAGLLWLRAGLERQKRP